ncbi:MAG: hypothetical protein ACW964_02825 [Candidatus Hodarchaeales archaeon]
MTTRLNRLLSVGPKVINIGLISFFEASRIQGIPAVHVRWEPPAQGDPELIELLDRLI